MVLDLSVNGSLLPNACYHPQSTEITFEKLREANGDLYSRHVIPRYGHIDCIYGKNAVTNVYPLMLASFGKNKLVLAVNKGIMDGKSIFYIHLLTAVFTYESRVLYSICVVKVSAFFKGKIRIEVWFYLVVIKFIYKQP